MTVSMETVAEPTAILERLPAEMLIGDRWQGALEGGRFVVEDPATEQSLALVSQMPGRRMRRSRSTRLRGAQEGWAATPPRWRRAACLFTDLDRAWRIADRLDTGMVGVNRGVVSNAAAPFGGTKHAGLGREGGPEGSEEYLETRYVLFAGSPVPTTATDVGATP